MSMSTLAFVALGSTEDADGEVVAVVPGESEAVQDVPRMRLRWCAREFGGERNADGSLKMNCMAAMSTRCFFYGYFQMDAYILLYSGMAAAAVFGAAGALLILCQRKKYKLYITLLYGVGMMISISGFYYIYESQNSMQSRTYERAGA